MREVMETVMPLNLNEEADRILNRLEEEIQERDNDGWCFVKAEPDKLLESVRLYFERIIDVH